MTDLAEWLLAQYDADVQVAQAAIGDTFQVSYRGCGGAVLAHLERQSSAHVLADLATKRRIAKHLADTAAKCPEDDWPDSGDMAWAPLSDQARYLLRLLALPYADREGYDPAWAPTG